MKIKIIKLFQKYFLFLIISIDYIHADSFENNFYNSLAILVYKDLPWNYLLALGVLASFQQFCLAESHRYADASALAPFHYLAIPMGVAFGVILFNETITVKFITGALIIVASNYYILIREKAHA